VSWGDLRESSRIEKIEQVEQFPDIIVERGAGKKQSVDRVEFLQIGPNERIVGFDCALVSD
jgi:hypothetical protein